MENTQQLQSRVQQFWNGKLGARALAFPGVLRLATLLGLPAQKLERHRELARQARDMSDAEWLSRNTDGPDNPDHWGPLDRALPAAAVAALGRRWGWHRIVYAAKPAA